MIPVAEAQARVLQAISRLEAENVSLDGCFGRVLAAPVAARVTNPPADVSAMDGYAVRHSDRRAYRVTGVSAAGAGFHAPVGDGEAVRIFTGAPVPPGADSIILQENVTRSGDEIRLAADATVVRGKHIRRAGHDFRAGDVLLPEGLRLSARDLALAAAMNHAFLPCVRKPRVAILATGDELVPPGQVPGLDQIVSSSPAGLSADIASWGGDAVQLGIAADRAEDIRGRLERARDHDLIVTIGGASVGDYDLVQSALAPDLAVDFWKIAMRPGKPLISGVYRGVPLLGLPGNPVSAFVCALLFIKPAIYRFIGATDAPLRLVEAELGADIGPNDVRQDYCRATCEALEDGRLVATPLPVQDSGMLRFLAAAQGLIVRPPHDPARKRGERVSVLPLGAPVFRENPR
jgi:molybdopterin molybdotransferase